MDRLNTPHRPRESGTRPESESTESHDTVPLASLTSDERIYQPLDQSKAQIRLLWLDPGAGDSEIVGTLQVVDLPSLPYGSKEQDYLAAANGISKTLYTATNNDDSFWLPRIARWERLYRDLTRSYIERHVRSSKYPIDDPQDRFEAQDFCNDEAFEEIRKVKTRFLGLLIKYQEGALMSSNAEALNAISKRLRDMFPPEELVEDLTCLFDEMPRYEAISYCCGNQDDMETMCLNGIRVQAPRSAVRALRGLRYGKFSRAVWIDAICIDSNSPTERSHQVMLMADIYASAGQTLIWLDGEHDETIKAYHASLRQLTRIQGAEFSGFNFAAFNRDGSKMAADERACHKAALEALSGLFKDPWFTRLWVYQEATLGITGTCCVKDVTILWASIGEAAFHHFKSSPQVPLESQVVGVGDMSPGLQLIVETASKYTPRRLRRLLFDTATLQCANPRDKIYAILGLTVWARQGLGFPETLCPVYSAPVEVCMRDATLAVIQEDESLECLTDVMAGNLKPSWAVPWHQIGSWMTKATRSGTLNDSRNPRKHIVTEDDCSGGNKLDLGVLRVQGYPDSLFLRGHLFDRVVRIVRFSDDTEMLEAPLVFKLTAFLYLIDFLIDKLHKRSYADTPVKDPKLVMFLILGEEFLASYQQNSSQRASDLDEMRRALRSCGRKLYPWEDTFPERLTRLIMWLQLPENKPQDCPSEMLNFSENEQKDDLMDRLDRILMGSISIFMTERNHMGFGHSEIAKDDLICYFYGARKPIMIRATEHRWFKWICPSGVSNCMDGSYMRSCKEQNIEPVVFEIR